jgi:hypothetical protein
MMDQEEIIMVLSILKSLAVTKAVVTVLILIGSNDGLWIRHLPD